MKCWNCGKKTMFPWEDLGIGWFKCSGCGATWIKMLELAASALGGTYKNQGGVRTYHSRPIAKGKKAKKESK